MNESLVSISAITLDKIAQLAELLSQASHLAWEISQIQPNFQINSPVLTGIALDIAGRMTK